MSFSSDVKDELIGRMPSAQHCRIAELCGYFVYKGMLLSDDTLEFVTENPAIAKKVFTFLKKSFNIGLVTGSRKVLGRARTEQVIHIPDSSETANLLDALSLGRSFLREGRLTILREDFLENPCCKRSFLRAAYCMAGTMNDPGKSYHFEIAAPEEAIGRILGRAMDAFSCPAKITTRRENMCLYLKDGDCISNMLNVMEAHSSLLRFENERTVREFRGQVNRQVNLEVSNLRKTAKAAEKQIEDIKLIRDTVGLDSLPKDLCDMALLRLSNPEAALGELGLMLVPALGRSGVNHRLQKLCSIAESLRQ